MSLFLETAARPSRSHIPHVFGAIERPRLLTRLHQNWLHPLTVIHAPAGYGKTILASQFAADLPVPVGWCTLSRSDRDPGVLQQAIIAALTQIFPLMADFVLPQGTSLREQAVLLARFLKKVDGNVLLVIDEFHQVDGASAAESWLRSFIQLLPRQCHVMLVSRTIPKLDFIDTLAKGGLWGLGEHDLRFSEAELDALARTRSQSLDSLQTDSLLARLDGWPAGIGLALQPLPGGFLSQVLETEEHVSEALFEKLALKMLEAQAPELQDFLLASSTLEHFTRAQCQDILGISNSELRLQEAASQPLFLSQTHGVFTCHALFREVLQKYHQRHSPDSFARLHLRAGDWFERYGQLEAAFQHYLQAGDVERAQQLATSSALLMYGQNRFEVLVEWRHILRQLGQNPAWLAFACAMVHTDRSEHSLAEAELDDAEVGARATVQRAFIAQQRGQYQAALDLLNGLSDPTEDPQLHSRILRTKGIAHLWQGDIVQAIGLLEAAVAIQREQADASNLSHLLQDLQVAYTRASRLEAAGQVLHEIVALRRELGGASGLALALNNLGYHYHQLSRYEAAITALEEGMSLIAEVPTPRIEGGLHWTLGNIRRDLGQFPEALRLYRRALQLCPKGNELQIHLGVLLSIAYLRRWEGQPDEALRVSDEVMALADQHHIILEKLLAETVKWAVQALATRTASFDTLEVIMEQVERQQAFFSLLRILAIAAHVASTLGQEREARDLIRRATRIAETIQTAQPLAAELFHSPPLFDRVIHQPSLYSKLLQQDFEALQAAAQENQATAILWPVADHLTTDLRIQTLGREVISRNGVVIPVSRWRGARSRKLFFYLLFNGPQSLDSLGLHFWPDRSEGQIRDIFHTTLGNARGAVGKDTILFEEGRYRLNPAIDIECDASDFERLVHQANLLWIQDPYALSLLQRAAEMYQGDFLPSVDDDWALALRVNLHNHYLRTLKRLGSAAQMAHDPNKATGYWQRVIDLDPLDDEANLLLIKCLANDLGQKHLALEQYARFQQLLADELGAEPGDEMREFVATLIH